MDPTKVDKKYAVALLALLAPILEKHGVKIDADDMTALLVLGATAWHAFEVWDARRAAKQIPPAAFVTGPQGMPCTSSPSPADPAPPAKAP